MPLTQRLLFPLAVLLLVAGLAAAPAAAQSGWRADGAFYLKPRLGFNSYAGDRTGGDLFSAPGPSTGLEAGYQRRLGPTEGSLGLYFLAGRYPGLNQSTDGRSALEANELDRWRHTLAFTGQLGFLPDARVNPYVQLGAGVTGGFVAGDLKAAFSPLAGVGLDVALTSQVGFFVETTAILSLPDRRLDLAEGVDDRPADWLSFFGSGLRIGLNRPFTPVRVLAVDGPTRLTAGEEAVFTTTANEDEATGPVTYQWNFGDGAMAEGATVTHRFETPGNYTLTLTGRNRGSTDQQLLTVSVAAPATAQEEGAPDASQEETPEQTVRFADRPEETTAPAEPAEKAPAEATSDDICGQIAELNATFFAPGEAALNAKGRTAVQENIEVLERCPDLRVRLAAYVAPGEQGGGALAAERARAVQQRYVRAGIAARRITGTEVKAVEGVTSKLGGAQALRRVDTLPAKLPSPVPTAALATP